MPSWCPKFADPPVSGSLRQGLRITVPGIFVMSPRHMLSCILIDGLTGIRKDRNSSQNLVWHQVSTNLQHPTGYTSKPGNLTISSSRVAVVRYVARAS